MGQSRKKKRVVDSSAKKSKHKIRIIPKNRDSVLICVRALKRIYRQHEYPSRVRIAQAIPVNQEGESIGIVTRILKLVFFLPNVYARARCVETKKKTKDKQNKYIKRDESLIIQKKNLPIHAGLTHVRIRIRAPSDARVCKPW